MTVKIVTDSTSDISQKLAAELGITVVPLTVSFGNEHFKDGVSITPEQFFTRLTSQNIYPTTTQPSPGLFLETFEKLCEETDEILVITVSSKLSGTLSSAKNAAAIIHGRCQVEVIDSQRVIMGTGLLAIYAAELAKTGLNLKELSQAISQKLDDCHPIMYFDTLTYLHKGGRMGKAQSLVGTMLSIKPILKMEDGIICPLSKVRSPRAGMDYLYKFINSYPKIKYLAVEHATSPEDADELVERLGNILPKEQIFRSRIGPVVGTYTGANAVAVTVLEDK
ncbi:MULTISPECIES: DegV family protein [Dehalococcoides]|uniref:DegV family protein n=2 Tax=Dehalococcoides mccartyi TaxID=61435 RepID=A0A328EP65_9CHLR|nr:MULTISPECIES: DegV family protein [Dehalococcoides]RAL69141.1 DegV family protein [Dehalococcoides mccartyi]CAI83271.1 degV family protein [Dehalococcoides mccartyi CBDB1]